MAHSMASAVQREIRAIPGNDKCVDCGARGPQWASVNLGTLFCLECSGTHRSLGVHLSFVRSITMDSWSEKQIASMKVGGNDKLKAFFKKHNVDLSLSISEKYNTPEAELYRDTLRAERDGKPVPTKLSVSAPRASSRSRSDPRSPASSVGGGSTPIGSGGGSTPGGETPLAREMRLRREAEERLRAKFGNGGLKGQAVSNSGGYAGDMPDDSLTGTLAAQLGALSTKLRQSDITKKATDGASDLWSTVSNKVKDAGIKDTATDWWSRAASGATDLFSRASAALDPAASRGGGGGGYRGSDQNPSMSRLSASSAAAAAASTPSSSASPKLSSPARGRPSPAAAASPKRPVSKAKSRSAKGSGGDWGDDWGDDW